MTRKMLSMNGQSAATALCLILVALLLAACSKVTNENYRQIRIGMTYPQIVRLLGEPTRCDSLLTARSCIWGDKGKRIDIQFVADQVVLFSSQGL